MKRGAKQVWTTFLDALVNLLPIIVLLGILFGFIGLFYLKGVDPELQDFQRIISELDDLIEQEYAGTDSIEVPIQPKSGLDIVMYPAKDSPDLCKGLSCICVYTVKDTKIKTRCVQYQNIRDECQTTCGGLCFSKVSRLELKPGDKSVIIKRGCNEVTIT